MARKGYPRNWPKVSRTIRRLAGNHCEWCQSPIGTLDKKGREVTLSVHHIGVPYADGSPGDPHDKHDLRRENLVALCWSCHWQADLPLYIAHKRKEKLRERGRLALVPLSQITFTRLNHRSHSKF